MGGVARAGARRGMCLLLAMLCCSSTACTRVGFTTPVKRDGQTGVDQSLATDGSFDVSDDGLLDGTQDVATQDDSTLGDADELGPFDAPILVSFAGTGSDSAPALTGDYRQMLFGSSDRAGGVRYGDIWVAQRTSSSDPWGTPTLVEELSTDSREGSPAVTRDGLTVVFASARPGGAGAWDIWIASRETASSRWEAPEPPWVPGAPPQMYGRSFVELSVSGRHVRYPVHQLPTSTPSPGMSAPFAGPTPSRGQEVYFRTIQVRGKTHVRKIWRADWLDLPDTSP